MSKTKAKKLQLYLKIALPLFLLFTLAFLIFRSLPSPSTLQKDTYPISTKILDRHGKLLYEIYADQNRTPVKIKNLPQELIQATIAIEDQNFYRHHGLDTRGIIRAGFKTLTGKRLEGGSTITQQLVKVALLTSERTLTRKFKEAILSIATEILYSKAEILEMYLNYIPYGGTAYGIEAASQYYLDKSATDLNLEEAALLAGLPQAPTRYSPFSNPDKAKTRQTQVLNRMVEENFITREQAQSAAKQELNIAQPFTDIKAPHFVMYIKNQLVQEYGLNQVERGGLQVTTTLDLKLQEKAEASLSAEINKLEKLRVSNGASLITNPQTGEILAMIGSRNFFSDKIDGRVNVTTRLRQPGSSIKPLNYALGLETKTITPSTMLLDIPTCFLTEGQPKYCPKNYDGKFRGPVQIRYALANSYNLPAVKVLALNDIQNFFSFAKKMGITTWKDLSRFGLSLTLGGGEVKMTDMATAFGVFANQGSQVPLQSILEIRTHNGKVLEKYDPSQTQKDVKNLKDKSPSECLKDPQACPLKKPLSPQTSFLISHILSDPSSRAAAFGYNSVLDIPKQTVSVKTGTTNDLRDNWTIGYTPTRLVAVWVGNNDNSSMSYVASGITGASPIWNDLMTLALEATKTPSLEVPKNIETHSVCTNSGTMPAANNPCSTRQEYFLKETVPTNSRITKKEVWINQDTQKPPQNEQEYQNVKLQEHLIASDPFTQEFCLDCNLLNQPKEESESSSPKPLFQEKKVKYQPGAFILNDR